MGALNLHVTRHALDDRSARVRTQRRARMFVAYASLALAGTDRVENLEKALVRRDVIGQAKGILMNQYDVDADEAFARLRRASQTTNTKLYDVAAWLVACRDPLTRVARRREPFVRIRSTWSTIRIAKGAAVHQGLTSQDRCGHVCE